MSLRRISMPSFFAVFSIIWVSSCPARPTNGMPCASSSAPGPSPTKTSGDSGLPTPKTILLRPSCRGQRNGFTGAQREHDFVFVGFEAEIGAAHDIADHHVAILGFQFAARFLQ